MRPEKKHQEAIIKYYEETTFDYHVAWLSRNNLALHFGFYDQNVRKHQEALLNTNRILANLSNIKKGEKVLDAGCGLGGSCFWLAENLKAEVSGISLIESQIEKCKIRATELKMEKAISFFQSDFCKTPFPDSSFHVVWAVESLCHAVQKNNFYQEAYRLLKPGGRLIIADFIRKKRPFSRKDEKLLASWLKRWAIPGIDRPEQHLENAQKAGFKEINIRDFTSYTWISLKNLHKISRRWIGLGIILRLLGIRSKIQHGNHIGSIRQFQALKQGLWFYGVISARKLK